MSKHIIFEQCSTKGTKNDKKIEEWFDSEEGKSSFEELVKELKEEEKESERLEKLSQLKYPNGEKVRRLDLFVDLKAKERYGFKSELV